jgi:alpha,alpha-trehalase
MKNDVQSITRFDIEHTLQAIQDFWPQLTRYSPADQQTLIGLPHAYVVPSLNHEDKHFSFDEMYYWDSYFIAQGLFGGKYHDIARGMCDNMLYLIRRFDFVPNANRYYFTGRSQPPLLTSYIRDIYEYEKDIAWLEEAYYLAQKEYTTIWTSEAHPYWHAVHDGLSRYYDINLIHDLAEAESGWDMTSRFEHACLDYIPIDLNCMLYKYEVDFARIAEELGREQSEINAWHEAAERRKKYINKYLWDDTEQFFFDYNYVTGKRSPVWSLAAYFALWSGVATGEQAAALERHIVKFEYDGGLSATDGSEFSGQPNAHMQWAYPNMWAPLQFIVSVGLQNYGCDAQAKASADIWVRSVTAYYKEHGFFREAYNAVSPLESPEEGLYPAQEGFGWTNGVYAYLAKHFLL